METNNNFNGGPIAADFDSERGWKGHVEVMSIKESSDGDFEINGVRGFLIDRFEFDNVICNVGKSLLVSALAGTDTKIRHMAWGNSTTGTLATDTRLTNEVGRKQITNQSAGSGTGQYVSRCYLGPNDANGTIEELGWFAGTGSTDAKDSGVCVAHVSFHYVKTSGNTLIVTRTDTIG